MVTNSVGLHDLADDLPDAAESDLALEETFNGNIVGSTHDTGHRPAGTERFSGKCKRGEFVTVRLKELHIAPRAPVIGREIKGRAFRITQGPCHRQTHVGNGDLRQKRAVGAELETEVLFVYLYDGEGNAYKAEKNACVIQLGEFGGEGGGSVQLTYTIGLNGNPAQGTATVADGTVTFSAE